MTFLVRLFCCCTIASAAAQDAKHTIFAARELAAERVTAVSGGGHFPVMIRLQNGDLVAAVRGGGAHVHVKGRLDWIRSKDQGRTWTRTVLADAPLDDRNPAVGQLADGTVLVAYHVAGGYGPNGEPPPRGSRLTHDGLYILRSHDNGMTWDPPVLSRMPSEPVASAYGKIVQLRDGTAMMAVYNIKGPPNVHVSNIYRSRDGGKTWGDPSHIANGFDETALALLPDGRLLAVLRSQNEAYLAVSISQDEGRTWSTPRQITAAREHPADVIVLAGGKLLLSYGERNRPYGIRARLSSNSGMDWGPETLILAADCDNADCGYPSSVEVSPGRIVTVYYGVSGAYDAYGKDPETLSRTYTRAVLWSIPDGASK